jgi:hypothetical protein
MDLREYPRDMQDVLKDIVADLWHDNAVVHVNNAIQTDVYLSPQQLRQVSRFLDRPVRLNEACTKRDHPFPALLHEQAGLYLTRLASRFQDKTILEIGAEFGTPTAHHVHQLTGRDEMRCIKKQCELGPLYDNRHCQEGAVLCDKQAFLLHGNGVHDISLHEMAKVMSKHGASIGAFALTMPEELFFDTTVVNEELGYRLRFKDGQAIMTFNDQSLGYSHSTDVWRSWRASSIVSHDGWNYVVEEVTQIGFVSIFIISRSKRGDSLVRPITRCQRNYVRVYDVSSAIDEMFTKLNSFRKWRPWLKDVENFKRILHKQAHVYISRELYDRVVSFLVARNDNMFNRNVAMTYINTQSWDLTINDVTIHKGSQFSPFEMNCILMTAFCHAAVIRYRQTKGLGALLSSFSREHSPSLATRLLNTFDWNYREDYQGNSDKIKALMDALCATNCDDQLVTSIQYDHAGKPILPVVQPFTMHPGDDGDCLDECLKRYVGRDLTLGPMNEFEFREYAARNLTSYPDVTIEGDHVYLQCSTSTHCEHGYSFMPIGIRDTAALATDYKVVEQRRVSSHLARQSCCLNRKKTEEIVNQSGCKRVINLCASPLNDHEAWRNFAGGLISHLRGRRVLHCCIPVLEDFQSTAHRANHRVIWGVNALCKTCLDGVFDPDALYVCDLGLEAEDAVIAAALSRLVVSLKNRGVKFCVKAQRFLDMQLTRADTTGELFGNLLDCNITRLDNSAPGEYWISNFLPHNSPYDVHILRPGCQRNDKCFKQTIRANNTIRLHACAVVDDKCVYVDRDTRRIVPYDPVPIVSVEPEPNAPPQEFEDDQAYVAFDDVDVDGVHYQIPIADATPLLDVEVPDYGPRLVPLDARSTSPPCKLQTVRSVVTAVPLDGTQFEEICAEECIIRELIVENDRSVHPPPSSTSSDSSCSLLLDSADVIKARSHPCHPLHPITLFYHGTLFENVGELIVGLDGKSDVPKAAVMDHLAECSPDDIDFGLKIAYTNDPEFREVLPMVTEFVNSQLSLATRDRDSRQGNDLWVSALRRIDALEKRPTSVPEFDGVVYGVDRDIVWGELNPQELPELSPAQVVLSKDECRRALSDLSSSLKTTDKAYKTVHSHAIKRLRQIEADDIDEMVYGINGTAGSGKTRMMSQLVPPSSDVCVVAPYKSLIAGYRDKKYAAFTIAAFIKESPKVNTVIIDEVFACHIGLLCYCLLNHRRVVVVGDRAQLGYNDGSGKARHVPQIMNVIPDTLTKVNISLTMPLDMIRWANSLDNGARSTRNLQLNSLEITNERMPKDISNSICVTLNSKHLAMGKTIASQQGQRYSEVHVKEEGAVLLNHVHGMAFLLMSRHSHRIIFHRSGYLGRGFPSCKNKAYAPISFGRLGSREKLRTPYGAFEVAGGNVSVGDDFAVAAVIDKRDKLSRVAQIQQQCAAKITDITVTPDFVINTSNYAIEPVGCEVPAELDEIGEELRDPLPHDDLYAVCPIQEVTMANVEGVLSKICPTTAQPVTENRMINVCDFGNVTSGNKVKFSLDRPVLSDRVCEQTLFASRLRGRCDETANYSRTLQTAVVRYAGDSPRLDHQVAEEQADAMFRALDKYIDPSKVRVPSFDEIQMSLISQVTRICAKQQTQAQAGILEEVKPIVQFFLKGQMKADMNADAWERRDAEGNLKAGQGISALPKVYNHIAASYVRIFEQLFEASLPPWFNLGYGKSNAKLKKLFELSQGPGKRLSVDMTQQDCQKGEHTDIFWKKLFMRFGVPAELIDVFIACHQKWHLNGVGLPISQTVLEKGESGDPWTLTSNTVFSLGAFLAKYSFKNLRFLVSQGDDIFAVCDDYSTTDFAFDKFKVEEGECGTFCGKLIGPDGGMYLDLPRCAVKLANKAFSDNASLVQYMQAVRDWFAVYHNADEFIRGCLYVAYHYDLTPTDAFVLAGGLLTFARGDMGVDLAKANENFVRVYCMHRQVRSTFCHD